MAQAAIGFRAHSGWAALVVVAGPAGSPTVIDRRRIIIADPEIRGSKQPFHAAEMWPLPKAEEFIGRCTHRTNSLAQQEVAAVLADLREKGHSVIGSGILGASGRPVNTLAEALASHPMLHTAEGELFRNALVAASEKCLLPITRVKEKELFARAAEVLRAPAAKLQRRVSEMGKPLGPPWTQDEKHAALIAWMVLAGAAQGSAHSSKRRK